MARGCFNCRYSHQVERRITEYDGGYYVKECWFELVCENGDSDMCGCEVDLYEGEGCKEWSATA